MQKVDPKEQLDEHDIKILNDLSTKLLEIWSKEIEDKQLTFVYNNLALDEFMSVFTLMVNDFIKNKNIKNYISHAYGSPRLVIDAPIRYSDPKE